MKNLFEKSLSGGDKTIPQKLENNMIVSISGEISDEMFVKSNQMSKNKQEQLTDPKIIEIAKAALPILTKEGKAEDVKLVNKIIVGDISDTRHSLDIITTGLNGGDSNRVSRSSVFFDMKQDNLDDSYPAREKHWIIGEKGKVKELIDKYKEIFEKSGGKVQEYLANQGYSDFSEAWIADFDRHVGFLREDGSVSE